MQGGDHRGLHRKRVGDEGVGPQRSDQPADGDQCHRLGHAQQDGVGRSDDVGHLRAGIADIAPHEAGDTVGRPGDGAVDDDDVVARFLQPLGEQ